jgi:hypothetical protein
VLDLVEGLQDMDEVFSHEVLSSRLCWVSRPLAQQDPRTDSGRRRSVDVRHRVSDKRARRQIEIEVRLGS